MDQRGARQPGHERGVFNRVPEPPSAPAQDVIGPGAAQQNADGQEGPGGQRPGADPARPQRVQFAGQERGNGEGKGHREAHVAHVQHGRMHDHAGVLQQRVQVAAGHRGRDQAFEGVGQEQQEQQQAHADPAHHRQHASGEGQRQAPAAQRHGQGPRRQQVLPQQQGSFMASPDRREPVGGGQVGVRIARHVQHRKVVVDERPGQAGEGQRGQAELADGGGPRHAQPRLPAGGRADQGKDALRQRDQQRQDQAEQADLGNHRASTRIALAAPARLTASAASGGM
ncbi:hypothetical protein D3C85_437740 [compost metagenome]